MRRSPGNSSNWRFSDLFLSGRVSDRFKRYFSITGQRQSNMLEEG
jgi:hypothetical protein